MLFASTTARKTLWWTHWVVLALLLKAAVPMLASAAAQAQGKTLVEVCSVYGVRTIVLDSQDGAPLPAHPDGSAAHGGEHCVLSGLLALSAPEPTGGLPTATAAARRAVPAALGAPTPPDAASAWAARLRHGPPRAA